MTAINPMPERQRMQAVLMERHGTGWRVGIGGLLAGRIDREATSHMDEREARAAAIALADSRDLIAMRT